MLWRAIVAWVPVVALLFSSSSALGQTVLAGATEGQARVSDAGAATYDLKITLPPGVGDMVPDMSVQYSSHSGNGILGVGWSVTGMPLIRRCQKVFAIDGAVDVAKLTNQDAICLGTERLILVSGTHLANGAVYRTEKETFSRITAIGTQGNGPLSFTLEAKTGRKLELGNTADSRVISTGQTTVLSWHLNKATDRAGNYFNVEYANEPTTGGHRPTRILYTGNAAASSLPFAEVEFVYETRPDLIYFWERGFPLHQLHRLTNLRTKVGTTVVRDYRFNYQPYVAPSRSRLASVQECTGTAANASCLPPTLITWREEGAISWALTQTPLTGLTWDSEDVWMLAEVLGNGHAQLVAIDKHSDRAWVRVYDPTMAGYVLVSQFDAGPWEYSDKWYAVDVNADGRADIVQCEDDQNPLAPWSYRSDPVVYLSTPTGGFQAGVSTTPLARRALWASELTGDGRSDLALRSTIAVFGSGAHFVERGTSNGDGTYSLLDDFANNHSFQTGESFPVEINGDGRLDVGILEAVGTTLRLSARMWGEVAGWPPVFFDIYTGTDEVIPLFADLNGDGKADIIRVRKNASANPEVMTAEPPRVLRRLG